MDGGELQVMKINKFEGISRLNSNNVTDDILVTVNYEKSGRVVFVQGSEILHHVTAVKSAKENRLLFVMGKNFYTDFRT